MGPRPAGRGGPPRPGSGSAGWSCSSSGACGTPAHVTRDTCDTCHDTHHTDDEDIAHQAHCHDHSEGHGHDVLGQTEHHLVVNIRGVVHCYTTAHGRYMTAIMRVFLRLLGCMKEGRTATRSRVGVPSSSVSPVPPSALLLTPWSPTLGSGNVS